MFLGITILACSIVLFFITGSIFTVTCSEEIHYGIPIVISLRHYDPSYLLFNYVCLNSVINQIYSNWTILAVGDALTNSDADIILNYLSVLPKNKYIFKNLPLHSSEKYIYKTRTPLKCGPPPHGYW